MQKTKVILTVAVLVSTLFFMNINAYAISPETELLLKLLERKGLITKHESAEASERSGSGGTQGAG